MGAKDCAAAECWRAYVYYQNKALRTNSIADDFYSRLALSAWFDKCEEMRRQTEVSLFPRKSAQHEDDQG
jgi:hypothetical protein